MTTLIDTEFMQLYLKHFEKRFWKKVDIRGEDECWPWKSGFRTRKFKSGRPSTYYGIIRVFLKQFLAHRVAWELYNGQPVPPGKLIRHTCDNPPCCNPKHLIPGTVKQNNQDMYERGRNYIPESRKVWTTKLTEDQVREIFSLPHNQKGASEVAKRYGVNESSIRGIWMGRTWKRITQV